ncbi:hypothetical protein SAMN02910409_0268 [Prevotellaceae bacterium HUN156]|nr:hypothetical protein SAMN02910409_0268 [Prevotellaceae bacterium HUN156]
MCSAAKEQLLRYFLVFWLKFCGFEKIIIFVPDYQVRYLVSKI